jgi:hypothetical protein
VFRFTGATGVNTLYLADENQGVCSMGIQLNPLELICDANYDGVVDAADYIALKMNFGTSGGATKATGEFDGDGDVDWDDLQLLMANFGAGAGTTPAPAPEPGSLSLLALLALSLPKRGALAVLKRKRKS